MGTHWIGGWVNPGVCLDAVEMREALHCRESKPGRPACSERINYFISILNTLPYIKSNYSKFVLTVVKSGQLFWEKFSIMFWNKMFSKKYFRWNFIIFRSSWYWNSIENNDTWMGLICSWNRTYKRWTENFRGKSLSERPVRRPGSLEDYVTMVSMAITCEDGWWCVA